MKTLLSERQLTIYVVDTDKSCNELSISFASLQVLAAICWSATPHSLMYAKN
jgi:hypothetical protein